MKKTTGTSPVVSTPTLKEIGVSEDLSRESQALADLSEKVKAEVKTGKKAKKKAISGRLQVRELLLDGASVDAGNAGKELYENIPAHALVAGNVAP